MCPFAASLRLLRLSTTTHFPDEQSLSLTSTLARPGVKPGRSEPVELLYFIAKGGSLSRLEMPARCLRHDVGFIRSVTRTHSFHRILRRDTYNRIWGTKNR